MLDAFLAAAHVAQTALVLTALCSVGIGLALAVWEAPPWGSDR